MSRVLQERAAIAETDWLKRSLVTVYGQTRGGVLCSLAVLDQMRLLAVGFHELLRWAVRHEIATILLDFPRIVEDGEYLVSHLEPVLAAHVNRAAALSVHAQTAKAGAIRVREQRVPRPVPTGTSYSDEALDREALVMLIRKLERETAVAPSSAATALSELEQRLALSEDALRSAQREHQLTLEELRETVARLEVSESLRVGRKLIAPLAFAMGLGARHRRRQPVS